MKRIRKRNHILFPAKLKILLLQLVSQRDLLFLTQLHHKDQELVGFLSLLQLNQQKDPVKMPGTIYQKLKTQLATALQ